MSENKCCGSCKHFKDEDIEGFSYCEIEHGFKCCDEVCVEHEAINNGWTEIAPDNVHEVYEKRGNIAFMNPTLCDYATICHNVERKILDLYALRGGYYYYVLPELKIE